MFTPPAPKLAFHPILLGHELGTAAPSPTRAQYFVVLMLNLGSSCFVLSLCSWEANSLTTKYISAWRGIELEIFGLKDMSCLQNKEGTFRNDIF